MRQIFISIIFVCLFFSFSIQAQTANAELLRQLLDLPAPGPGIARDEDDQPEKKHPPEFYDPNNPPADNAPLAQLLDYWQYQSSEYDEFRYNIKPSKEALEKIFKAVEENPNILPEYLNILPPEKEVADSVKRIYENRLQSENFDSRWMSRVRSWLKYNSDMFINELLKEARNVKEANRSLRNQQEFISLSIVDWEQALPLVENLESEEATSSLYTLAKYVRYQHALKEDDSRDTNKYRQQLMEIVENKKASHKARDLAMDAIVLGGDFEGRDQWYLTLLEDETLLELQNNGFTGLTTLPRYSPKNHKKWIPEMVNLIGSNNRAVRSAAIRNLLQIISEKDTDFLKLLLPWLTDAEWASESRNSERKMLVRGLGEKEIPEAIPGLIAIVMNEDNEMRAEAAESLALYKAPEAIPALRFALENENDDDYRKSIISGLIAVGGLSADEQVAALEAYAILTSTEEGQEKLDNFKYGYGVEEDEPPISTQITIGEYVSDFKEPSDAVVLKTIERIKQLRRSDPPVAKILIDIMQSWNNRFVDLEMLRWLETGTADLDSILRFLAKRVEIRENIPNELFAMRGRGGLPGGISTVISGNENEFVGILNGTDNEAKAGLLAAARLVRAKLPVRQVSKLLNSQNKLISLAAGRYLESEDSAEARSLILAKYPNEVRLLGARTAFIPDREKDFSANQTLNVLFQSVTKTYFWAGNHKILDKAEDELRQEIKDNKDLQAVYALLLPTGEKQVVRSYTDKILFTIYQDEAHYLEKTITPKEYEMMYRFLVERGIDRQKPSTTDCDNSCPNGEFIMFGRSGGRRIYYSGYRLPKHLEEIQQIFAEFGKENTKLHYRLAKKLDGLEILLADQNFVAHAVWKNGDDLRVLVEDVGKKKALFIEYFKKEQTEELNDALNYTERSKLRRERIENLFRQTYSWRNFESGQLSDTPAMQPDSVKYISGIPTGNSSYYTKRQVPDAFNRTFGNFEIRSNYRTLTRVDRTGTATVIKKGLYETPIITPDGKWIVVGKRKDWNEPIKLFRINLLTNKETEVPLPESKSILPVGFVASHAKVLIARTNQEDADKNNFDETSTEYYLLDVKTGALQKVKGEFRPLIQRTFRDLQTTGKPSEYWAAIYDKKEDQTNIGRYNTKTFSFESVLTAPEIKLSSMNIWVDKSDSKVYFVYKSNDGETGHLLSLPLPK